MNLRDLIGKVSLQTSIHSDDCLKVIYMFLRELNKAFLAKENIEIRNFGRFKIVKGAARKGKNLSTGKPMEIPAQYRVRFYPSSIIQSKMKEIIK